MKYDLILIGSCPPPVGGVTMHVKRLRDSLERNNLNYYFVDLRQVGAFTAVKSIFKGKQVHLHTSNVYFKFFFSIICFLTHKKLLLTYHGNINRYKGIKNFVDKLALLVARTPIVLNKKSLEVARPLNSNTVLISAFIPPATIADLDQESIKKINALKAACGTIFCTNAYNVSYDKLNREIYQVTDLIKLFNKLDDKGLIISDPSGMYAELLESKQITYGHNILLLPFIHDFNAVIREADCMIRFTTTDGDSLSVKESLFAGKPVIATNVVDRPREVILINNDIAALEAAVRSFEKGQSVSFCENGFDELYEIYSYELGAGTEYQ